MMIYIYIYKYIYIYLFITNSTVDIHKDWTIEVFYLKASLNYWKIDNSMYQNTFINTTRETLKIILLYQNDDNSLRKIKEKTL